MNEKKNVLPYSFSVSPGKYHRSREERCVRTMQEVTRILAVLGNVKCSSDYKLIIFAVNYVDKSSMCSYTQLRRRFSKRYKLVYVWLLTSLFNRRAAILFSTFLLHVEHQAGMIKTLDICTQMPQHSWKLPNDVYTDTVVCAQDRSFLNVLCCAQ